MKSNHIGQRFSRMEIALVLLCFLICLHGALCLPMNNCPDEGGRKQLSDWIAENETLPTGDEPGTILVYWWMLPSPDEAPQDSPAAGWGFSYALRPYLTAILAAVFTRAASLVTASPRALLAASRMGSVLSLTMCCYYCLRLGHRLFEKRSSALLLAVMVCFLPQAMFLGMYQNNDVFSLCAVCMALYYCMEGYDRKWTVRSCVGLAISFSLGLLSYYSVYGWLLMCAVFCVLAVLTDPEIPGKGRLILRRAVLIAGICLLLAGWFFIRNALAHDGDFLGIVSEKRSRAAIQEQGYVLYDYVCFRAEGMSISQFLRMKNGEWLRLTAQSFFGVFDYMLIYLPNEQYGIYYALLGAGFLLFLAVLLRGGMVRRDRLLLLMLLFSSLITLLLHFWQSYTRDYQPQGRYVITLILFFGFMTAFGLDRIDLRIRTPRAGQRPELPLTETFALIWIAMFVWAFFGAMKKMFP